MAERGSKIAAIREYLKKHPDANFKEFFEATKVNASNGTFYRERKIMKGGYKEAAGGSFIPPDYLIHAKMKKTYDKLAPYLKENPEATYGQMISDIHLNQIASSTFSRFKKRCLAYWKSGSNGRVSTAPPRSLKKKATLYQTIFTADSSNLSDGSKNLLKQFVDALNESKVGRYEVREYRDPKELEVREVQ